MSEANLQDIPWSDHYRRLKSSVRTLNGCEGPGSAGAGGVDDDSETLGVRDSRFNVAAGRGVDGGMLVGGGVAMGRTVVS